MNVHINQEATLQKYKYPTNHVLVSKNRVICECPSCNNKFELTYHLAKLRKYPQCRECLKSIMQKHSKETAKKLHSDPGYKERHLRACQSKEHRLRSSKNAKKRWDESRDKMLEITKKAHNNTVYKQIMSDSIKEKWQNAEWRQKMLKITQSEEQHNKLSKAQKLNWQNDKYKNNILQSFNHRKNLWNIKEYKEKMLQSRETHEFRNAVSAGLKEKWKDKEFRNKVTKSITSRWQDPDYKVKMAINREARSNISSLQTILYSILDDLGVKYHREREDGPSDPECTIGPYNFDCVIPREGKTTLLVECQGEYWHGLDDIQTRDKAKANYITNNFADKYEIKYIWEHEFKCKDRVAETIKYWLGISKYELIDFKFENIIMKPCVAKDYRLLLSKYHYLANAGRGGIAYGAYLKDELIAVCVFSPPLRQNIKIKGTRSFRELSRLCIHPRYQKKNFASWFISRCIKQLGNKYEYVVSYCDTTFNHDGAVYKACNFILDGKIKPDYWYVDNKGWVMHKKTLYEHAKKFYLSESEFAAQYGYLKTFGKEKLRFIYRI